MEQEERSDASSLRSSAQFATTHWSIVVAAGESRSTAASTALETLCRTYWYPLYAFARRRGHSPEDAKDLTQSFLASLVEKRLAQRADPDRGRFRTFLLRAFTDFLTDQHRRHQAAKRGGGYTFVALSVDAIEDRLGSEVNFEPELLYDLKWALTVVAEATKLLEAEYHQPERASLFATLSPYLQGERGLAPYAEIGKRLGLSEGAVRVSVFRLRRRYRELLRAVVARTVNDPLDIDDELRHLVRALA